MTRLDHPGQRLAGFIMILLGITVLDPTSAQPLHSLWLPLTLAAGALLLTRAPFAVCLAATALALLRMDLHSSDWVTARGYPLIALGGAVYLGASAWRRFRGRSGVPP